MPQDPSIETGTSAGDSETNAALRTYWRRNLLIMSVLLAIWAGISLGCGILWVDFLNQFTLFDTGFPLGFWFAQQGSIIGFVLIVLVYALLMNRADRVHHRERRQRAAANRDSNGGPSGE